MLIYHCWVLQGLEYVDDGYRLSCVVTNNYSDWSTQQYPSGHLSIRIYKLGNNYVVICTFFFKI